MPLKAMGDPELIFRLFGKFTKNSKSYVSHKEIKLLPVLTLAALMLTNSACNVSSVKVRITSKPAIWPMERSGIGQIAGRRRPLPPESGLAGARPWLDNGGVKI